ncbi:MAG: hypothetical protein R2939_09965 [Kofleriaceae bacterium]
MVVGPGRGGDRPGGRAARAAAGARVVAEEGVGQVVHKVGTTVTDADGRYRLRALAGAVTLTVALGGHGEVACDLALGDRGAQVEDFRRRRPTPLLWGQVVDASGAAAAGCVVRLVMTGRASTDHRRRRRRSPHRPRGPLPGGAVRARAADDDGDHHHRGRRHPAPARRRASCGCARSPPASISPASSSTLTAPPTPTPAR